MSERSVQRRIDERERDGAPAIVGRQMGAVRLIEEKVSPIMKLHCIIHEPECKNVGSQ